MNTETAVLICRMLETISFNYNYHVALTGGCLYKTGERKDIDILFYSVRQKTGLRQELLNHLETIGFTRVSNHGWMNKFTYLMYKIDFFFPEEPKSTLDEYNDTDNE